MKVGGVVVAGVVLAGGAFLAGKSMVDKPTKPVASVATASSATTVTAARPPAGELAEFRDDKAGWAISVPKDWNRLQPKDADIALVVSEKPAEQNIGGSILARDLTPRGPGDDANLAAGKEGSHKKVARGGVPHNTQPPGGRHAGVPGHLQFFKLPG